MIASDSNMAAMKINTAVCNIMFSVLQAQQLQLLLFLCVFRDVDDLCEYTV